MTPAEIKTLLDNIVTEVNSVADVASFLGPQVAAAVAVGKAVDKQIPGLVAAADAWIQGNPPTDADKADFAAKLGVLGDPNAG